MKSKEKRRERERMEARGEDKGTEDRGVRDGSGGR